MNRLCLLLNVVTSLSLAAAIGGSFSAAAQEPGARKVEEREESLPGAAERGTAAHGAGNHHDPTDLTHGNASPALKTVEELRFDLSLATFVVFVFLLAILAKFAWGPIAVALEQREETIARQIEEARLASERAAQQLKEYEAKVTAATDEARQIVAQARKDAEVAKDHIVAEASGAAQKERDRAVADITAAKNHALDEIAQKTVQTAISLASNIIRREVKPQEHEALIGEAINEFSKLN